MYPYLGDFPTGATIFFPFHTYNANGASVTISGLAITDIEVYKGTSMTQRSSDNGYTLTDTDGIDLDGITGIHGFSIDTSDDSDSGFFAAGNDYVVVCSVITVDSQTVSFIAGRFSIDNRGLLRPTTAQRTLDVTATGEAGLDFANVNLPTSGAIAALSVFESGTLQSATSTTAVLRSATSLGDDRLNGLTIYITGGTGAGQSRVITDYVNSTDTATVDPAWATNPDNTSTYFILPSAPAPTSVLPDVNVKNFNGAAVGGNFGALVNAEVVDALNVDTYAEPGQGAPAATASLATKLGHLFKAWRNKTTETSSQYSVYADDGTTIDSKATVSDDGTTVTRGEMATGP